MYDLNCIRIVLLATTLLLDVLFACVIPQSASSAAWLGGKPTVALHASKTSITIPCPRGMGSISNSCPTDPERQIRLNSTARDFGKQPLYVYTVGAGGILGEGSNVVWNLSEVGPGIYTATVEVRDNKKRRAVSSVTVTLANCPDCVTDHDGFCPPLVVMCYDEVKAGTPITCKVVIPHSSKIGYHWTARSSGREDLSATLTSRDVYVSIPTNGLAGQTVYATVEVRGLDSSCSGTASSATKVKP